MWIAILLQKGGFRTPLNVLLPNGHLNYDSLVFTASVTAPRKISARYIFILISLLCIFHAFSPPPNALLPVCRTGQALVLIWLSILFSVFCLCFFTCSIPSRHSCTVINIEKCIHLKDPTPRLFQPHLPLFPRLLNLHQLPYPPYIIVII